MGYRLQPKIQIMAALVAAIVVVAIDYFVYREVNWLTVAAVAIGVGIGMGFTKSGSRTLEGDERRGM